jgi:hypothetical protein
MRRDITEPFLGDDSLFIHEMIAEFSSYFEYDSDKPSPRLTRNKGIKIAACLPTTSSRSVNCLEISLRTVKEQRATRGR